MAMEIEVIVTDKGWVECVLIDGKEKDCSCITLDKYLDRLKKR